jgi:hypothetical protein
MLAAAHEHTGKQIGIETQMKQRHNLPNVCVHSLRVNFMVIGAATLNLFTTTVIGYLLLAAAAVCWSRQCEYVKRTPTSNVRAFVCCVSSAAWVPDSRAAEYCLFVSRCRHVRLSWATRGICDAVNTYFRGPAGLVPGTNFENRRRQ